MHLAITHPFSWPEVRRGAERIVVETAAALAARGHEVTIITAGTEGIGRRTVDGVTTVKLRRRHEDEARHMRWFGWRVLPVLALGGFDAVHSMMPGDAAAAIRARRVRGHRVLYDEMGIPDPIHWQNLPDRRARGTVATEVDVYACMSQCALEAYLRAFPDRADHAALVPGGVDLDEFHPAPRSANPSILYSGTLSEARKGVATLLEAVALLAPTHPDLELWLSGPGDPVPLLGAAPEAARSRTKVLPLGEPGEQATRYASAHVTALPSTFESFGMVLLESLASGTPIVVTDHSAPQELVRPGAGVVTRAGDARSLADGLAAALALGGDPELAARCRDVASAYSWAVLAERLEALYRG